MDVDTEITNSTYKLNNFENDFYKEPDIGYSYSEINPDVICWSCKKIMNNPFQSYDCGCLSCHDCLEQK